MPGVLAGAVEAGASTRQWTRASQVIARYRHAARELERFSRLCVIESVEGTADEVEAKTLLRLSVGIRRRLDQWPPRT